MDNEPNVHSALAGLNENQTNAVKYPVDGQVQILAGPGTGKTKTLTARVAYMLLHENIDPQQMIVMTFTKAATEEMRERIRALVGPKYDLTKLKIGTFHSVMARYLNIWGEKSGMFGSKITILDTDDCETLLGDISRNADITPALEREFGEDKRMSTGRAMGKKLSKLISQQKNMNKTLRQFLESQESEKKPGTAAAWRQYENVKTDMVCLDFDDILLLGRDLIKNFPECVSNIKTVLVDEFQDSNEIQMDIVKLLANECESLTIVGDPDQSIYGFRGAVPENMAALCHHFPSMEMIYLEQNYRSTQQVLDHATKLIQQEEERLGKDRQLFSTSTEKHTKPQVVLCEDSNAENATIAEHVNHLLSSGLFNADDISILFRKRQPMKNLEKRLRAKRIPCHIVNGIDFWDRAEIKTIICYLRIINKVDDRLAVERTINVPKREVGSETLKKLNAYKSDGTPYLDMLETVGDCKLKISGVSTKVATNIKAYVGFIRECRRMLQEDDSRKTICNIIDKIQNELHIVEEYVKGKDDRVRDLSYRSRTENIDIMKDLVLEIETGEALDDHEIDVLGARQGSDKAPALQQFLSTYALDDTVARGTRPDVPSVTLSTIHGAKGLEWPVVFLTQCNEDDMRMGEDDDSVRRLIYVAITRAKTLSYVTHFQEGSVPMKEPNKLLGMMEQSVKDVADTGVEHIPRLSEDELALLSKFLKREYKPLQKEQSAAPTGPAPPALGGFVSAASMLTKRKPLANAKTSKRAKVANN